MKAKYLEMCVMVSYSKSSDKWENCLYLLDTNLIVVNALNLFNALVEKPQIDFCQLETFRNSKSSFHVLLIFWNN